MVHKIIKSKYGVFIESLILTLLILTLGFLLGFFLEMHRTSEIVDSAKTFEIENLDLKLQNYYYQIMDESSCEQAIEQNFIFADNIYEKGLDLERYEQAGELTDDLLREKKKYVLLKTELWLNSILLKEKCGHPFDTVTYIYANDADIMKETEQKAISNVLKELKEEKENDFILIPIAGDLDLGIVNIQLNRFDIDYLPSVIINEKTILKGFHNSDELRNILNRQEMPGFEGVIKLN